MKRKYKDVKFTASTLELVELIDGIVADYECQGYVLTLRQLYYQLVCRNVIANRQSEYKRVGDIVGKARLAGLLDWDVIIDRTRELRKHSHWSGPAEIIRSASHWYHIDTRSDQPVYVEIWSEKDALASVLEPIVDKFDIPLFICKGYPSITSKRIAANRLAQHEDQNPTVIYVGDHDPSGLDIPRELRQSFDTFGCFFVAIRRIALTMLQVEEYSLPPNPAKLSDSRATRYIAEFGSRSWELDSLRPSVLSKLVEDAIDEFTDYEKLNSQREIQAEHRSMLRRIVDGIEEGEIMF